MNSELSEIIAGTGLGIIKFGMTRDHIQMILGIPTEKDVYSYSGDEEDNTENWHYDDKEISLGFDEEDDWKLVTLSITSKDYNYSNFTPIGLNKLELTNKLKNLNVDDLEYEDMSTVESPSHELVSSDQLGINFWFDEDTLSEVQWGPLFADSETIKWPD